MAQFEQQNNQFESIDVKDSEDSQNIEDLLDLQNNNDPSTLPNSSLRLLIRKELSILETQLLEINEKLKHNQESLILKKNENEEMKKVLEIYQADPGQKKTPDSCCGFGSKCTVF